MAPKGIYFRTRELLELEQLLIHSIGGTEDVFKRKRLQVIQQKVGKELDRLNGFAVEATDRVITMGVTPETSPGRT